ncbi:MAG: hypothetical protein M1299_11385 [Firmicutes bacterium]|nr:hypothetical protein [Bacillota bacterium]
MPSLTLLMIKTAVFAKHSYAGAYVMTYFFWVLTVVIWLVARALLSKAKLAVVTLLVMLGMLLAVWFLTPTILHDFWLLVLPGVTLVPLLGASAGFAARQLRLLVFKKRW